MSIDDDRSVRDLCFSISALLGFLLAIALFYGTTVGRGTLVLATAGVVGGLVYGLLINREIRRKLNRR